ncbi:related to VPS72-component of the SWR1 complex, required for vacuolar protein sorting [Sporisorium scitamineum]|uniref:Related to VPS72-component of the SWR1 complex, required for vacuolar protein sorting n=2 Tax=Sporisorium scitamineum TaxID=49012 RepID=A0A127ZDZ4_9BASI|nr:related to VPS72-component of the SWR1 complex, required for vacuolar protein sorting [Sporisorium scitamineum]
MPTSRSSPAARPSRSASPEANAAPTSSFRIERYDSTPTADLMVTSRSKRSTAGNRLKALLDQELEKDQVFAEVENDIDFEANENEDGVDIVDSDFDRDSDDDARAVEDESEGEREIEAQEKADKQKRRAAARAVGIIKRPAAASVRATRRPAPESSEVATKEAKRRRISFAPDQPSSSPSAGEGSRRRTSARAATVQSKLEVESRFKEASQRRAAQPVKQVVKKKAALTQDALIAEALEVEEENRESLRRFLEQEEERRAKQRQRKERITGPFVRWMSVGLKTKVVEDITPVENKASGADRQAEDKEKGTQKEVVTVDGADRAPIERKQTVGSAEGSLEQQLSVSNSRSLPDGKESAEGSAKKPDAKESEQVSTPPPAQPDASVDPSSKGKAVDTLQKDSSDDVAMVDSAASAAPEAAPSIAASTLATTSTPPTQHRTENPAVQGVRPTPTSLPAQTSTVATPPPPSNASLTLDPVIAARQQAALLRSTAPTTPTSSRYELQARTLLSVERMPSDWDWLDEFNALLGTHCTWDSYPFVPSRNRPLKPRQSICPITGLPAIYKDPRTGIAYANAYAYKVIGKLLEGRFVWSGGHYEEERGGGEEGGEGRWGEGGGRGGAVEMGVYLDDEQEVGPGKVWLKARDVYPTKTKQNPTETPTTQKHPSPPSPSPPTTSATSATSAATSAGMTAEKKKSKPGFDVVLTNALAPGDEKAVLAAALSLPAGSTRSGRRVQRSSK